MGAAIDLAATYTEADPNSRIGLSTVTATFTGVKRDENAYVYKDWGAAYFGDFVHDFETTGVTWANGSKLVVWGVSDTVAAMSGWTAGLYLLLNASSTTAGTYTLGEVGGAAGTSVGASIARTIMYWRIERNGLTCTAKRASSAANRTAGVWVETLTISCANTTYRYQFAGSTFNDANTTAVTQTTANFKGTKMTSAGTPFDTAYMAGASAGDWNAGATWGNTGSTKGTDFPGTAADVVNIDGPDTVTYNVSETNALGTMDIYGTLSFKKNSNTKLIFGQVWVTVKNGGSLILGTVANPIDASHTAELYWTATSDNIGLNVDNGGTFSMVGVDQMGDTIFSYLTADWTAGQTFTVHGDVTAKWAVGQTVAVHKFQSSFQATIQTGEFTIASMAANGSDTDITISEAAPGVTFRAGGIVAHLTRNVIFGKTSATLTMGNTNTNRPRITLSHTTTGTVYATLKYVSLVGFYGFAGAGAGLGVLDVSYCVLRNGYNISLVAATLRRTSITKTIIVSFYQFLALTDCILEDVIFLGITSAITANIRTNFDNCYFVNCYNNSHIFYSTVDLKFNNCDFVDLCYITAYPMQNAIYRNANCGKYRHHANTCTTSKDFVQQAANDSVRFYNSKFVADPPTTAASFYSGQFSNAFITSDDHDGTLGDTRRWGSFFASKSNATVVRGGGSSKSLEITNLDYCNILPKSDAPILEWVEWDVAASAQTRKIYIRGGNGGAENWSTYPTATELFFEAEYYDEAGTCHKAFAVSTAVLTDNTTWTEFLVTFTPGRVGQVVYRLWLGLVIGVASVKLYVDPQLNT